MKRKIIFTILCLVWCVLNTTAQNNISVKIEKGTKAYRTFIKEKPIYKEESTIKVKITNNNPSDIIIFNRARWSGYEGSYDISPSSYFILTGNPSGPEKHETGKIVLSQEMDDMKPNRVAIQIKAGQTYIEEYQLFGEDYGPIKTFPNSKKSTIKSMQIKLQLAYFYVNTRSNSEGIFYSNTVWL